MKNLWFNKVLFFAGFLFFFSCNHHIAQKENLQKNQKADTNTSKTIKQVRIDHGAPNQEYIDSIKTVKTRKKR